MGERKRPLKAINTENLPLLPLRDIVVFPTMAVPLFVGREKSIRAVEFAIEHDNLIMLSAQKSAQKEDPKPDDIYEVGCIAEVAQIFKMPDGTVKIMVEGLVRAKITDYKSTEPLFVVDSKKLTRIETKKGDRELEVLVRSVRELFPSYVKAGHRMPMEILDTLTGIEDPEELCNAVLAHVVFNVADRQAILKETDIKKQFKKLADCLEKEIDIQRIEKRLKGRVKKQMDKTQRDYYLNEQIKAIQKELGHSDAQSEIGETRERIKKSKMPKDVEFKALKELRKLEQMPPMSAEGTVVRNYLEWLLDVPWSKRSKDNLDTKRAKKVLDEDHFGLQKIKERIVDYLAVRKLSKSGRGPILCFVGPPGVGKTSLGKSIARALGRKFVRVSLGGIRDEAEIRGHRRTYIGALPGRIIQSMKKAGTVNPVIMLDEVDKMSVDFRGDPSSALLEALDPEQNNSFSDHYLEVDYNLSGVMFITTANVLHTIPAPLLDRMEVLRIAGYTEHEKMKIASNFLLPKQMKEHGLKRAQAAFSDGILTRIVRHYTREAGVRNLERTLAKVCRKIVRKVVEKKKYNPEINSAGLSKFLGPIKFRSEKAEAHNEVGFALGLAWTETGGEIMNIEVSVVPGKGKLTLTGKLGDVMRESAHAALTYIRSRAKRFGLSPSFHAKNDIHIHVPEGAIPKDGPSAGITMAAAMVSAFCKVPVRHGVAMTGEVTLRGKVLPIGGLKEKTLAAHRAGIRNLVIPIDNKRELEEIPGNIRKEIKFLPVESMDEVLGIVMTEPVFMAKKKVRQKKKPPSSRRLNADIGIN
ncbi:MAG: endopeptidase La [Nitrospinota bacterium]